LPDDMLTVLFIGCETAIGLLLAVAAVSFLPPRFDTVAFVGNIGSAAVRVLVASALFSAALGILHIIAPKGRD